MAKAKQTSPKKAAKAPQKKVATAAKKSTPTKTNKPATSKVATAKTYSIAEFAAMTYLTEHGVTQWLKQGRLLGQQSESGEWLVDAANLDVPNVKRLVRENKTR